MSDSVITTKINVRLINTHDTSTNWATVAESFVPEAGEFIIYDIDSSAEQYAPRVKIGDGVSYLKNLPFSSTPVWIGKKQDYTSEVELSLPIGTIVYITDDNEVTVEDVTDTTENVLSELPTASANYRGRTVIINKNGNDQPFMCLYRSGSYK